MDHREVYNHSGHASLAQKLSDTLLDVCDYFVSAGVRAETCPNVA